MAFETLTLAELEQRLAALESIPSRSAAIGVNEPAVAAYVRVVEFGSLAGQRPWPSPGPRTTLAFDPKTGQRVVVTLQAPQGFIRVRAAGFLNQLRAALRAPANWLNGGEVTSLLEEAVQSAARTALDEVRSAAPQDSSRLRGSLVLVDE